MVDATSILLFVVTILTGVFIWSRRTYVYWQRRRVKFVQPTHLLGNLKDVLKMQNSFALQLRDYYFNERFTREPLVGIYLFHQPALLLRDLQLVRQVLIEDFVNFSHRFSKCDGHQDKMGALNLFFARNPEWRDIRTKLAPVFTTAKMKQMFSLMEEIGYDLETYLAKLTKDMKHTGDGPIVQIKDICDLYNTDMIASIAFGLRTYSLRNTYRAQLCRHSHEMFYISFRRAIDLCLIFIVPKLVNLVRPKLFTAEHTEFLRNLVVSMLEDRRRYGGLRNDLIEVLLTFKMEAELNKDKSHFTHQQEYLVAQAATFQLAGIQTCASTLAFALYELARQPKLQERLHLEIRETIGKKEPPNSLNFERVEKMPYLSMVVEETLRKYPVVPFLERECTPLNKRRFVSFRPHAECMARRGMPVYISNLALHYDPQYWPNPEHFDPERFSPDHKKSHTPLSYLPFGAGPHHCIAQVLAQLQLKLGLIHFLNRHRVEVCDKTVDSIKFDKRYALLTQEGGIYLKLVEI
ncbi:cytochrome P450 6v1 isoform 1-T3 [Cochliomyia hominivorax]